MSKSSFACICLCIVLVASVSYGGDTSSKPMPSKSDPEAAYQQGLKYFKGDGVSQNNVEAYMWFHIAVDLGNSKGLSSRYEVARGRTKLTNCIYD